MGESMLVVGYSLVGVGIGLGDCVGSTVLLGLGLASWFISLIVLLEHEVSINVKDIKTRYILFFTLCLSLVLLS